jgi:class 3 adenylate cyclase/pimeloyl-ACP methyl ester carboxylesterase
VTADIQYAQSGDVFVAYQVIGDGPRDILVVMDGFIPVDTMDDEPRLARSMRRLASFGRLIRFDRRGIGLSDPVSPSAPPMLEQWVDDAVAVLDAAGSTRATILGAAEAGVVAMLLAATYPARVAGLVLVNCMARVLVDSDFPHGLTQAQVDAMLDTTTPSPGVPSVADVAQWAPSAAHDAQFREWWSTTGRRGASPATARALLRVAMESDVRSILSTVHVPALIMHFADDFGVELGRDLAARLPHAKYLEIPGADNYWWAADNAGIVLDETEEFVTGMRGATVTDRVLATVLFTDIVGSTERLTTLGDREYRDLLDRHDAQVRRQLARFRGREVKSTGDGFLATFDGPARALECAVAIRDATRQLGIEVRGGVHTGEVEVRGDDIGGIAVHIAARVNACAAPGSVWLTRTVTELVVGSGIEFADRGEHDLKGVPGTWHLFEVVS